MTQGRDGISLAPKGARRLMGVARRLSIVAAAFFMETLDSTIVATALPAIARDLGASTLDLTASITVYLVAMAVFVPTAGWASARNTSTSWAPPGSITSAGSNRSRTRRSKASWDST